MDSSLKQAKRVDDLLAAGDDGSPYNYEDIFRTDTWRSRRLSKRKLRALKRVDESLQAMLDEGERVFFLTFGSTVGFWESYFAGWIVYYLNQRVIALTTQRMLLMQISSGYRPRPLRFQLVYDAIVRVKGTLLGNTKIRARNGKSYLFTRVPKADRKYIQQLVEELRDDQPASPSNAVAMENLCPHCHRAVAGRPRRCPECGGRFKSASVAGWLSFLFPGLGDLYLGHWKFAIFEILCGAFIWLAFVLTDPETTRSPADIAVEAGFVVLVIHGIDALATRHIGLKGLYPAGGTDTQEALQPDGGLT